MLETYLSRFRFELPENLIAKYPLKERSATRLLLAKTGENKQEEIQFSEIIQHLSPQDLLVFNTTRVLKSRLYAQKPSGCKVEIFILELVSEQQAHCLTKGIKQSQFPLFLRLLDKSNNPTKIELRIDAQRNCWLDSEREYSFLQVCELYGHVPIPPYMRRKSTEIDEERYQTLYAEETPSSVAAPTAGLHFDASLLQSLKDHKIPSACLCLKIGYGTFMPLQEDNFRNNYLHTESFQIDTKNAQTILEHKKNGGRIIAVGTTSLRALESWASEHNYHRGNLQTSIFITPGYRFQLVDGLITNFHLPASSLFILVSSFLGFDETRKAYQYAINKGFRFYSYGDAMFINNQQSTINN